MLTKKIVQSAVSEGSVRKLADEKGLYLYISKVGGKSWRYDFRFAGKRFTLTFGKYPVLGLDDARRKKIDENFGINPAAIRIAAAIPSTLRLITFVVDTIPTFWL